MGMAKRVAGMRAAGEAVPAAILRFFSPGAGRPKPPPADRPPPAVPAAKKQRTMF